MRWWVKHAPVDSNKLELLLAAGWEPFAVYNGRVYVRRQTS